MSAVIRLAVEDRLRQGREAPVTWEIRVPYQSRDQTIIEAIEAHVDQALEGEDREVAFQLLFIARFKTMGELIDHVESLDTEGQRRVLDGARKAAGLEASEDIDSRERFERYNRALPKGRDAEGRTFQICAEPNCNAGLKGLSKASRSRWLTGAGGATGTRTRRDPTTTSRPSRSTCSITKPCP